MSFAGQEVRLYAWHAQGLDVKVWRKYEDFVEELSQRFPHEREGIKKFYRECWAVFNSLNSLELKSLEEPRYLLGGDLSCTFYSHLSYACKMTILSGPQSSVRGLSEAGAVANVIMSHCL